MRTIEQIDQDIDINRRTLMARVHANPSCSSRAWQNAWDRCPDLHSRERELFLERGNAQEERGRQAEKDFQRQRRIERAAFRKKLAA